ncbi:MAG: DUF2141 domain-containing protein [Porphyromonas pasteri]
MNRTYIALLFAIFFSVTALCAQSHRLTLDVVGMKEKKGNLLISVYDSAEDYLKKPVKTLTSPADALTKRVVLELESGTYAVVIYQDLNSNGKVDRNFFRLPTEPCGFSRDARPKMGPPRYKPASFSLNEDTEIRIKIK